MEQLRKGLVLLMLGIGGPLLAQNFGEIHGKLVDEKNEPLPFTSVSAQQGEHRYSAESDADGRFVLKPLPPGTYDVRVVAMNVDRTITGVIVNPDKITVMPDLEFRTAKELAGIDIVKYVDHWTPPLIDVDMPGVVTLIHTQFKHDPDRKNPMKLIEKIAPGVKRSANGEELYFRGSRGDAMAYYVDGVKVTGKLTGITADAVNSISVYTGGLPAKYGDVTGGVVAIETKSYFDLYQQRNAGIR